MNPTSKTLVWAEDNDEHFEYYKKTLTDYLIQNGISCTIYRAEDGNAVFRRLSEELPLDLLVVDLDMPNFNGIETIQHLSRRRHGLAKRLIIVSGKLFQSTYRKAVDELVANHMIAGAYEKQETEQWCKAIYLLLKSHPPRILHLSDIHFGKFHAFSPPLEIEQLLTSKLCERVQEESPNLIVISGDLTSDGSSQDFARAEKFITWLMATTHLPIERFVIIPGNHDIQRNAESGRRFDRFVEFLNRISEGAPEFRARFHDLYDPDKQLLRWDWRQFQSANLYSLTIVDDLRLVIVGFNSVVDDENDWARGEIPKPQLLSVAEALRKLPSPSRFYLKAAVFHHHLFPVPSIEDRWEDRILSNHGLVLNDLSKLGFRVIMHGHTHYPSAYQYRPYFIYGQKKPSPLIIVCTGTLGGLHSGHWFFSALMGTCEGARLVVSCGSRFPFQQESQRCALCVISSIG
jgi:CheY-like chemotaxis protein/predicted phosphodiesterase